jgi:hypothetical protein
MDAIGDASRIRCIHGKKNQIIMQYQCLFIDTIGKIRFKAKKYRNESE